MRRIQGRKNKSAVEAGLRKAGVTHRSHPPSEFEDVSAVHHRGVVLQFVVVLVFDDGALAVAAGW